jgi:hypothetical protein
MSAPDVQINLVEAPEITVNLVGSTVIYPPGAGQTQDFTQSVAQNTWTFNHVLNRIPKVSVTDLAGNNIIVSIHATQSQVIVSSESPITGVVYLS